MNGVLVDREALERVLSLFPDNLRPGHLGGFQPDVARAIQTARDALALPAQAAADAAGVLRQVADWREAEIGPRSRERLEALIDAFEEKALAVTSLCDVGAVEDFERRDIARRNLLTALMRGEAARQLDTRFNQAVYRLDSRAEALKRSGNHDAASAYKAAADIAAEEYQAALAKGEGAS